MISRILNYLNNLNVRQVLILAGISAGLMFAAIFLFLSAYTSKEEEIIETESAEETPEMTSVVVAKSDIAPRIKISDAMLEVKDIPSKDVPSGAITDKSDIIDKPAKITILAGDVITVRKLYKNEEQSGFVGTIPADCRAISIPVNDVTGVAGFAKPGDYVDLLLVENDTTSATTNIILQNVLLLSINQSMDRNEVSKEGENTSNVAIPNPSIVTVALRPPEALKLVSASKLGDIYLMLRPARPLENYVEGMEYKIISANNPPAPVLPAPSEPAEEIKPPEEEKREKVIEIIEGDEVFQTNESNVTEDKPSDSAGKK